MENFVLKPCFGGTFNDETKEKLGLNDMDTCHLNFFTNLIFPILEAKYSH